MEKQKEEQRVKRVELRAQRRAILKNGGDLASLAADAAERSAQFDVIDAASKVNYST